MPEKGSYLHVTFKQGNIYTAQRRGIPVFSHQPSGHRRWFLIRYREVYHCITRAFLDARCEAGLPTVQHLRQKSTALSCRGTRGIQICMKRPELPPREGREVLVAELDLAHGHENHQRLQTTATLLVALPPLRRQRAKLGLLLRSRRLLTLSPEAAAGMLPAATATAAVLVSSKTYLEAVWYGNLCTSFLGLC